MNTGNPDPDKLASATAVVDTGREFDPVRLRFDHHHLHGDESTDTCAALQVFTHLFSHEPMYIRPLVDLVFAGDTGRSQAQHSRDLGLHAIYSGWRAWHSEQNPDRRLHDQELLDYGFGLLDILEVRLRHQAYARAELHEKVVYRSDDDLVWAIRHGSQGSTVAAQEGGARLVVFEGQPIEVDGGTTYPIGVIRAGEWQEPHVGELAKQVAMNEEFADEIQKWFCHPAGKKPGRGTAKAPVYEPVSIDIASLAEAIDDAWCEDR